MTTTEALDAIVVQEISGALKKSEDIVDDLKNNEKDSETTTLQNVSTSTIVNNVILSGSIVAAVIGTVLLLNGTECLIIITGNGQKYWITKSYYSIERFEPN